MSDDHLGRCYNDLKSYIGWTEDDAARVREVSAPLEPHLAAIVEDFYDEIGRHPETRKVITGGPAQVDRLKSTLRSWLREMLSGVDDDAYVERRWRVGWRHVEIGVNQMYVTTALARIRAGLIAALARVWQGEPLALMLTAQSLNRRLDLDLALIEAAYQAEAMQRSQRQERLATIGQVAGGVAHELRNPLNVVKTSVYYLRHARSATEAKRVEHLERIERHVVLADGVITSLSNFARMPVPDSKPVDLAACLRESLDANPLPPTIALELDCPEDLPRASGDAGQLLIVFGNLIRNARDAMPDGGRLLIRARPSGAHIVVDVVDDGVGIAPQDLARVTEPLYTTKARGLGLGLAIARAILDKNQGSLGVVSEHGRGSTFTVRLMAVQGGAAEGPA